MKSAGSDSIKKVLLKHGAKEPCYGVKIEELKKIQKQVKENNTMALDLFHSGVYDAMYLAGLVGNGAGITKEDLDAMAQVAYGGGISSYTVPWLATEHPEGYELAMQWIDSPSEFVAVSGWSALSGIVTITPDASLDLKKFKALLKRVEKEIHKAPNRVRYAMNGFVIALGCYVTTLTEDAMDTSAKIGPVNVDMNGTACKVPAAAEYINKLKAKGTLGKKRKTVKC